MGFFNECTLVFSCFRAGGGAAGGDGRASILGLAYSAALGGAGRQDEEGVVRKVQCRQR